MPLTILIPSLNRPLFLLRQLRHYRDTGFDGCVMIGDSSTPANLDMFQQGLRQLRPGFEVVHRALPGQHHFECLRVLAPEIRTPFATYVCDDDLLSTDALREGMQFLREHPDYSAALGMGVLFELETDGPFGPMRGSRLFRIRGVEEPTAAGRLLNFMADYTVIAFSVNRTEQFQQQWVIDPMFREPAMAIEVFPCALIAAQGKVQSLDRLLVARHNHRGRYPLRVGFEWITDPRWHGSYQFCRARLTEELMRQDGLARERAERIVDQAFLSYTAQELMEKWQQQVAGPQRVSNTRRLAAQLPGLRAAWRQVRSWLPGPQRELSVEALRRPSSPYYRDFAPFDQAVTTPLEPLKPGVAREEALV